MKNDLIALRTLALLLAVGGVTAAAALTTWSFIIVHFIAR